MKPTLIIVIVIPISIAIIFAVFLVQSMPQQNLEDISEEQSNEVAGSIITNKTFLSISRLYS